jgi:hypothetical protein
MATSPIQRVLIRPNKTPLSGLKYYKELYKQHKEAIDSLEEEEEEIIVSNKSDFLDKIQKREEELHISPTEGMDVESDKEEENVSEEEEDNPKEEEESEEEEEELSQPLPALLKEILKELDVKEDIKQLSAVLGENIKPTYYKAVLFEGNPIDTRGLNKEQQRGVLLLYLKAKASIASCYPAATRLLELVGKRDEDELVEAFEGGDDTNSFNLKTQQSLVKTLSNNLSKASQKKIPIIFKIQLGGQGKGGHGFTLTVQGDVIYQLEALAGTERNAQLMISNIMKSGTKHTLEGVLEALRLAVSAKVEERKQGARMLGLRAVGIALVTEDETAITDPMNVYWIASPVASEKSIRERVAQQILSTREEILAIVSDDKKTRSSKGKRQKLG